MINVSHRQYIVYTAWCMAGVALITALYIYSADIANVLQNAFQNRTAKCKDCNILLVTIDSCSARNIGCYGYSRDTMPIFCALASQNILFSQAYTNAHWTLPGNMTLFTGLYPLGHKVQSAYSDTLGPETKLLHEVLQTAGYKTILHMPKQTMYLPESSYIRNEKTLVSNSSNVYDALSAFESSINSGNKTFLSLYAQPYCHEPYLFHTPGRMFTQQTVPGFNDLYQSDEMFSEDFFRYLLEKLPVMLSENEFADKTETMSRLYDALSQSTNFEASKRRVNKVLLEAGETEDLLNSINYAYRYGSIINPHNKDQMSYFRALYDERLFLLDSLVIGPIRNAIASDALKDNTMLIVTSQHGQEHGEHGIMGHHTYYDQNLQIPLVMRIPGVAATTVGKQVQLADIMPTILDVVGVNHEYSFDGVSLVPYINGNKTPSRLLITQRYDDITARDGNWKLFFRFDGASDSYIPYELYDTWIDPDEQNNILNVNVSRAKSMIEKYTQEISQQKYTKK